MSKDMIEVDYQKFRDTCIELVGLREKFKRLEQKNKSEIIAIVKGLEEVAKSDFNMLEDYVKDECRDYNEGYLEALNMVQMYFQNKL
jgi:hypothetical protein